MHFLFWPVAHLYMELLAGLAVGWSYVPWFGSGLWVLFVVLGFILVVCRAGTRGVSCEGFRGSLRQAD